MKKILSLALVLCMLLTVVLLPSCGGDGGSAVTTPQQNIVPSTPEELITQCFDKTAVAFFGERGETFDAAGGMKTNVFASIPALGELKLNADLILAQKESSPFFGLNVSELKADGQSLGGIRLFLTDKEVVAGVDAFLSRNLGLKFSEAEEQITALVSKLMPGTSVSSIRTEVKRYLQEIESALGSTAEGTPEITADIIADITGIINANIKKEMVTNESSVTVNVTVSLADVVNIITESVRALKDDDAWRAYMNELDTLLRESVFVDTAIPLNTTVLDYLLDELDMALDDEGFTTDSFVLKFSSTVRASDLLIESASAVLYIGDAKAISLEFAARYEGLASFTLLAKVHAHPELDTTEDVDFIEVNFAKTAKNATSSGFILKLTDKLAASESDSEGTINTFTVEYTKDSSDNRYELAIKTIETGTNTEATVLSMEGIAYENKDEIFFSIEELGSSEMGVTLVLDVKVKVTRPTEADLKLPVYDDLGSIKEAELSKIVDFINSLLPQEGEPEVDVNDSVIVTGKVA